MGILEIDMYLNDNRDLNGQRIEYLNASSDSNGLRYTEKDKHSPYIGVTTDRSKPVFLSYVILREENLPGEQMSGGTLYVHMSEDPRDCALASQRAMDYIIKYGEEAFAASPGGGKNREWGECNVTFPDWEYDSLGDITLARRNYNESQEKKRRIREAKNQRDMDELKERNLVKQQKVEEELKNDRNRRNCDKNLNRIKDLRSKGIEISVEILIEKYGKSTVFRDLWYLTFMELSYRYGIIG